MTATIGTPITQLHGECGLTHHQTTPLRRHDITTVERLAELVGAHRAAPDGSVLSAVPGFGRARIELACTAIDHWRDSAAEPVAAPGRKMS